MRAFALIALAILLVALPGEAEQLELGANLDFGYSDNVLSDPQDKKDDGSLSFAPYGRLSERNGEVQWELFYKPSFLGYANNRDLDGWEHNVRGNLFWQIDERTSLTMNESYSKLLSRGRFNQEVALESGDIATEVEFGVTDFQRNSFSATLTRLIDAGHSLEGTFSHSLTDFDEGRDNWGFSTGLSWLYRSSPRTILSLGPNYSRQVVEGGRDTDDSVTDFYGVTGGIRHNFGRGLLMSLSAGPSWIDSNQDVEQRSTIDIQEFPTVFRDGQNFLVDAESCTKLDNGSPFFSQDCNPIGLLEGPNDSIPIGVDQNVPSASDTRLTFFAAGSISKQWRLWNARLAYTRRESPSSGLGAASITDTVTSSVGWRPAERWRLDWTVAYTRRTQATQGLQPLIELAACGVDVIVPFPVNCVGLPVGTARSSFLRFGKLDSDAQLDQWTAQFIGSYRLRERLQLTANLYYVDQTQKGDSFILNRDLTRFTASIGLRWDLDPIPL